VVSEQRSIRPARVEDAERLAALYNHYIETTVVSFEERPVDATDMRQRIEKITEAHPWLVYEDHGTAIGYAYAGPWHSRSAYRFSAETTIYLAADRIGRGFGHPLYSALLDILRRRGFHCAVGGIALPNAASVTLHEKLGFRKVAEFKQIGRKFDRWIDVGYWELIL
jgi:phosphinothricin acetyltransferase